MKETVATDQAPAALGPYSQAIKIAGGTTVFCSGQIALDPATGQLVGATAVEQCRRVMTNLEAVLKAAGVGLDDVVKTTIYLVDMTHFAAVNEVYGEYFGDRPPARATVGCKELPKGALVEIDAVAVASQ